MQELLASRCVPALARGRGAGALGRVQGFPRAGLEALAWMAKHSALEPAYPYSTGRTHRLHDGELSPSNTPLPVGNPNPHVLTSRGRSVPSHRHTLLPCWGWPWLLGWRGRQICFPTACLWGWLGLPVGSSAPQTPPGFGGCPCVHQSIPSAPCSAGRAASGGCRAPCCRLVLLDVLPANCSCSDAFVYFSLSVPSPLHSPPPTLQEGSFAKSSRLRVERKHAEFVRRELNLPAARLPCLQLCPVPKHCPC